MIVDNALYRNGERVDLGLDTHDLAGVRAKATGRRRLRLGRVCTTPTSDELEAVADLYDLHELAVEDAISAHQRPKVERYADSLFIVLKTLWYVDEEDAVETGEISLFVGHKFVITVRHGVGRRAEGGAPAARGGEQRARPRPLGGGVRRVRRRSSTATRRWPASLQEDVDEVEQSVFSTERTNDSARIYVLKRELAEMRRAVMPLREPMNRFTAGSVHGIHSDAGPYFRDVADHLNRVAETIDSLDSLLSTAFEAHIAQISIQQNDDMRRISAAAGMIVAPTVVGSIYGMNFDHMPELHWVLGYPMALGLMALSSLAVYVISKRAGWL